jgi:hypothetical protein
MRTLSRMAGPSNESAKSSSCENLQNDVFRGLSGLRGAATFASCTSSGGREPIFANGWIGEEVRPLGWALLSNPAKNCFDCSNRERDRATIDLFPLPRPRRAKPGNAIPG